MKEKSFIILLVNLFYCWMTLCKNQEPWKNQRKIAKHGLSQSIWRIQKTTFSFIAYLCAKTRWVEGTSWDWHLSSNRPCWYSSCLKAQYDHSSIWRAIRSLVSLAFHLFVRLSSSGRTLSGHNHHRERLHASGCYNMWWSKSGKLAFFFFFL